MNQILLLWFCILYLRNSNAELNTFSEELLIKPLSSGHIYSHFEFTTLWENPSIENSIRSYKDYGECVNVVS